MTTTASSRRSRWLSRLALSVLLVISPTLGTAAPAQAKRPTPDIVDSTRRAGKAVALTFDDGPSPVDTPRLLRVLRKHRVKAVFCLWGDHVREHPDLVRRIAAEGHVLCNHSQHHDNMGTWSPEQVRADLEATSALIRRAVPGARIPYFRAPYGSWGRTPQVAAELGMQPLGWRLAIGDWEPPGTEELVRRLREGITPEAVVLLHDAGGDRSQTVEAVARIIPEFRAKGWRFDLPARRAVTRHVVGTWATAVTGAPASATTAFQDQTLRQVVRVSVGGDSVRVRLSNEFGDTPLVVGEARVAHRAARRSGEHIAAGSDRPLTFGGRTTTTIPPGAPLLSDPVALPVRARSDLVVSMYLPQRSRGTTVHGSAFQENYVAEGNVTGARWVRASSVLRSWYFLSGVSVTARQDRGPSSRPASIVALGDSITDGAETTVNSNRRWPDFLARRLQARRGLDHLGVLNKGISGNRLLRDPNPPKGSPAEAFAAYFGQSALARFDRDVLAQPGARYVVVLLGVNDLGHPGTVAPESETATPADLIAGYRQLIARARERGLTIYGATITPFRGDTFGFYDAENEAARQAVNAWIRTSGEYDGVVDFDAALRDPDQPDRLLPRYDSGDHLHPNDAGMRAMAAAVPLRFFREQAAARRTPTLARAG